MWLAGLFSAALQVPTAALINVRYSEHKTSYTRPLLHLVQGGRSDTLVASVNGMKVLLTYEENNLIL